MFALVRKFVREDQGISSVEYALLLAFVGAGVAAAAAALGGAVTTEMEEATDHIGN